MKRGLGRAFLVLALASVCSGSMAHNAPASPTVNCQDVQVPVSVSEKTPTNDDIYGRLCIPAGTSGKTVQLLVHGITYDHTYWDLPARDRNYSYVDSAHSAGFATFAIDRIGIGRSSHPPAAAVTIDSNAYVVHRVVQALRHGLGGSPGFSKVALVGHSYGTWTSWTEVTKYQDVDSVVLSGASHGVNPISGRLAPFLMPAKLDPTLSGQVPDIGYLTTDPGHRDDIFHWPGRIDASLMSFDEQHKQTVSLGEIWDFPRILTTPADIRVPVLLANGSVDPIFCGGVIAPNCASADAMRAWESKFLGPHVPSIDSYSLPGAGHDLNYAENAQGWFDTAQTWIASH